MVTVTTYELAVIARVLLTVKVEIVMAAMVLTMMSARFCLWSGRQIERARVNWPRVETGFAK